MMAKINLLVLAVASVAILSIVGIVDAISNTTNIPTDTVIERTSEEWVKEYDSVEKFEKSTKETVEYLTADLEEGWNTDVQQANLKAYNFESMLGKRGSVNELVALFVAKDQLTGSHVNVESISKYHDYMLSKHTTPTSLEGIDKRIYEIVGDERNYILALEVYESRNFKAALGSVPSELISSDGAFWGEVLAIAGCGYDETCDVKELRKILNFTNEKPMHNSTEEVEEFIANMSEMMMAYLLPSAYAAWDDTYHIAYQYINADSCDNGGDPCSFFVYASGVGRITPNASSAGIHTEDTTIYSYAASYGGNTGDYHVVSSQLTDPTPTNTLVAGSYDSVWKEGYLTKSSNESTYKATNTSDAYDP